jgi:hypothetical protein
MADELQVDLFFRNTRTGKEFKVIWINPETGKIRLKGATREFEDDYSKTRFQKLGYELVKKPKELVE